MFLTHSHADHTGALPWLYENGFCGSVIASEHTLAQLPFDVKNSISLESICSEKAGEIGDIKFEYGRSGHCVGSVWYHFRTAEKSVFFSGDYTEHSTFYRCDKIRGKKADIAVLDCAYGSDNRNFGKCCDDIISTVQQLKKQYNTLFFPVPKYGRGIELLKLFCERLPELVFCGDEHFLKQIHEIPYQNFWCRNFAFPVHHCNNKRNCDVMFISDPQLRSEKSREIAKSIIQNGGCGVMTGTVEDGSFSEKLILCGIMKTVKYPVHQNFKEFTILAERNRFQYIC